MRTKNTCDWSTKEITIVNGGSRSMSPFRADRGLTCVASTLHSVCHAPFHQVVYLECLENRGHRRAFWMYLMLYINVNLKLTVVRMSWRFERMPALFLNRSFSGTLFRDRGSTFINILYLSQKINSTVLVRVSTIVLLYWIATLNVRDPVRCPKSYRKMNCVSWQSLHVCILRTMSPFEVGREGAIMPQKGILFPPLA